MTSWSNSRTTQPSASDCHKTVCTWCKWAPMWMNGNTSFMYCCLLFFLLILHQILFILRVRYQTFSTWYVCVQYARNNTYLLWLDQVILFATSPVQVKQKHSKLKSIGWHVLIVYCMLAILNTGWHLYICEHFYRLRRHCIAHDMVWYLVIIVAVPAAAFRDSQFTICLYCAQQAHNKAEQSSSNGIKIDSSKAINSNTRRGRRRGARTHTHTCMHTYTTIYIKLATSTREAEHHTNTSTKTHPRTHI